LVNDSGERILYHNNGIYFNAGDLDITAEEENAAWSVWFYISGGFASSTLPILVKYFPTTSLGEYRIWMEGNKLRFQAFNTTTSATIIGTTGLSQTTWYHAFAVKNATGIYLWLNNVSQGSASLTGVLNNTAERICMGYYCSSSSTTTPQYYGYTDEVMIFDKALNSTEISEIYNSGNGRLTQWSEITEGLVGYWTLDQYYNNGEDYSINDNTATIAGSNPGSNLYTTLINTIGNNNLYQWLDIYYSFDGDTSTTAYTLNREDYDGTFAGNAQVTDNGYIGKGALFDGNGDYITKTLNRNNAFKEYTLSAWIYPNGTNPAGSEAGIISLTATGGQYNFEIIVNSSQTGVACRTDLTNARIWNTTYYPINQNEWTHVTCALDQVTTGKNLTLYVNGDLKEDINDADATTFFYSHTFYAIGMAGYTTTKSFNGVIDEPMIFFNKVLNSTEVNQIYSNTNSNKFVTYGTQTYASIGTSQVNASHNRVNISLSDYQANGNTNVSARLGYWKVSNGYNTTQDWATLGYGLVSHWTADGNANDLYGVNNGTLVGNANASAMGVYNNSFGFDGDGDYINISTLTSLNTTQCYWSKLSTSSTWNHYCNASGTGYVNGATGTYLSVFNISGGFIIGQNTTTQFNGSIDDVMIWSRKLSASEIKELYFKGRANWEYTNYTNLTAPNINTTFTIPVGSTNYLPELKLLSDSNSFYTPYINGSLILSSYKFAVGAASPNITIYLPMNNSNYTVNPIPLNYSVIDDDSTVDTCWYSLNGGVATTITGCLNTTVTGVNGFNTIVLYANDTENNIATNMTRFHLDLQGPLVSWYNQTPVDLDSSNAISVGLNITYNITDYSGINNNTVKLYYKVNSTLKNNEIIKYVNGTAVNGYIEHGYEVNNSSLFKFHLEDHDVYPATYNIEPREAEAATELDYQLSNANTYIKTRLYNVTNLTNYNWLEVVIKNRTSTTADLRFYYCNGSYTAGLVTTSSFCTLFNEIPATQAPSHCHDGGECDYVVSLAIANGLIGTVRVTDTSYFLIRGTTSPTANWNVSYIENITRTDQVQTTSNSGTTWSDFTGTTLLHLHQFTNASSFWYYACTNDTLGLNNCSSVREDKLELGNIPPTAPNVYNPVAGNYSGNISINYTASVSPNAYAITYYNITLHYTNETFVSVIRNNNTQNLSYIWDTSLVSDGYYKIRVRGYDTQGLSAFGESEDIIIDNTSPSVSIVYPENITYTSVVAGLNYTVSDLLLQACWWSNSSGVINYSITCGENVTVDSVEGDNHYIVWANDSVGHISLSEVYFYVDSIVPVLTYTAPLNTSSNTAGLVNIEATSSESGNWWYSYEGVSSAGWTEYAGNPTDIFSQAIVFAVGYYNISLKINDTLGNSDNHTELMVQFSTGVASNVTSVSVSTCRYKKLGYFNIKLPWIKQANCI
jgi:hypothetical protein